MANIGYTMSFQVANGPKILVTGTLNVDAYDKLEITVPASANNVDGTATVAVQPSAPAKVHLRARLP